MTVRRLTAGFLPVGFDPVIEIDRRLERLYPEQRPPNEQRIHGYRDQKLSFPQDDPAGLVLNIADQRFPVVIDMPERDEQKQEHRGDVDVGILRFGQAEKFPVRPKSHFAFRRDVEHDAAPAHDQE